MRTFALIRIVATVDVPTLASASRTVIDPSGGNGVVLTGTNLAGATKVTLSKGGVDTDVTPASSTSTTCTFFAPALPTGTYAITVTTPDGTSNSITIDAWMGGIEPGCLSWHDTSAGVTVVSGAVSALADRGPSGDGNRNLSQASGAKRPALISSDADFNGFDSISFDGINDMMQSGMWSTAYDQPITWYRVTRIASPLPDGSYYFDGDPVGYKRQAWLNSGGVQVIYANAFGLPGSLPTAQTVVVCIVFDGVSSDLFLDDPTTPVASGNAGDSGLNGITLGARYTDEGFAAHKLVANGTFAGHHDQATRAAIMGKLKAKYGGT